MLLHFLKRFRLALWCAVPLAAQSGNVVGAGYQAAAPVSAAPGQILTFFVDTPATKGIQATLRQGTDQTAPILDVRQVSTCPGIVTVTVVGQPSCSTLAAVTVQIPNSLIPNCPVCARPADLPAMLLLSVGGNTPTAISLNAQPDQIHILTACDAAALPPGVPPQANTSGLPCLPMVTHANGTLVSASTPANIGEEVVAWASGLGVANPPALDLDFNYRVNALATKPFGNRPLPAPVFAGPAPGFPGLYQINFVVPPEPVAGTPRCPLTFAAGGNYPRSNLTVSFGGQTSFDGAGICVATRVPVD